MKNKLTNEQRNECAKLYASGWSSKNLAEKYNTTTSNVWFITKQRGVNRKQQKFDHPQILNMYLKIRDVEKIMDHFKCARSTVWTVLYENGINAQTIHKGEKHNKLTILDWIKGTGYICRCDCGNELIVKQIDMIKKRKGGCKSCRTGKDSNRWCGHEDIPRRYITTIISNARNRNIEYNLSDDDLWQKFILQDRKCALSGVDIAFGRNSTQTASIDRINSDKGYTVDNIQWVHKDINFMKQELSDTKFINWCKLVCRHHSSF